MFAEFPNDLNTLNPGGISCEFPVVFCSHLFFVYKISLKLSLYKLIFDLYAMDI